MVSQRSLVSIEASVGVVAACFIGSNPYPAKGIYYCGVARVGGEDFVRGSTRYGGVYHCMLPHLQNYMNERHFKLRETRIDTARM